MTTTDQQSPETWRALSAHLVPVLKPFRGETAVSHRRDSEKAEYRRSERRLRTEPVAHWDAVRGNDLRHSRGPKLAEVVKKLEATVGLDRAMASYASSDAKRFV